MRTMRIMVIAFLVVAMFALCSYAGMDDKSDRVSANQSSVFSPGYINATSQKTKEIIKQAHYDDLSSDKPENQSNVVDNKLAGKVNEAATTVTTVKLQKKVSGSESAKSTTVAVVQSDSTNKDVAIGTGTKIMDGSGAVVGEMIGSQRYIYAGFNEGRRTISQAMDVARSGDIVLVRAGNYNESFAVKDGVSLYGGYNNSGTRNIKELQTTIYGSMTVSDVADQTVIDGFTISNASGNLIDVGRSSNLTISNNTFIGLGATGIYVSDASSFLAEHNRFNTNNGILSDPVDPAPSFFIGPGGMPTMEFGYRPSVYIISQYNDFYSTNNIKANISLAGQEDRICSMNDYFFANAPESPPEGMFSFGANLSVSNGSLQPNEQPYVSMGVLNVGTTVAKDPYLLKSPFLENGTALGLLQTSYSNPAHGQSYGPVTSGAMLKELIKIKYDTAGPGILSDSANIANIANNVSGQSMLSVPVNGQNVQVAAVLANILKNPTADQKLVLDTMTFLLNDNDEGQGEKAQSPELKKAQDDLLQVVANILIAQAIPDLLKEGDTAAVKTIFQDLNTQKEKLITDYNLAVQPYYKEVKKLLAKNIAILQLNNVVSKTMVEEELGRIEPNDVDKLLEKLRKASNKSFEESYILQEEGKLRSKYVDPNKKAFEDNMKAMLEGFTQRLSRILEATKK